MSCETLASQGAAAVAAICGGTEADIRACQFAYDRSTTLGRNENAEQLLADAKACVALLSDLGHKLPNHLNLDAPRSKLSARYGRLYQEFTKRGWVLPAKAEALRRRAQAAAQQARSVAIPPPHPEAPARACTVGKRTYQLQATGDPERPYVLTGSKDKLVAVPDPEQADQLRLLNKAGEEQGRLTRVGGLLRTPSGGALLASAIDVPAGKRKCDGCGQWRDDEHTCPPSARFQPESREYASLRLAEALALHPDALPLRYGQDATEQTAKLLAMAEYLVARGPLNQGHHYSVTNAIEAVAQGRSYGPTALQSLAENLQGLKRIYPDDIARLDWQRKHAAKPEIAAVLGGGDPAVAERVIDTLYHQERARFQKAGLSQLELHEAREGMGRGDGYTGLYNTVTGRDWQTRTDTTGLTIRSLGIGSAYQRFSQLDGVIRRQQKAGAPIELADLPLTPELRQAIDEALAANGQPTSPPGARTSLPLSQRFGVAFGAATRALRLPVAVTVNGERATVGNHTIGYEAAGQGPNRSYYHYTNGWAIRDETGKEVTHMGDLTYIAARAATDHLYQRLHTATNALPESPPKEDQAGRAAYVTTHTRACLARLGLDRSPEVQAVLAELEPKIPNKLWTRESMRQLVADLAYEAMIDGAKRGVLAAWGEQPVEA